MEAHLDWLRKSRRVPPQVDCHLPPKGEISLVPEEGERVVFISHFQRGFGLPASDFLRAFLDKFGLQPHHLPANAFVFLSAFACLFEGYLGLWPSLHHWAKYHGFRVQTVQGSTMPVKPMVQCGRLP